MPLNKQQKEAVEYLDGPLLVLAGPGTGKTQLLSSKVAYILENTDTNPENILCLTYTESGAQNMRDRLTSMIGRAAGKVNIHTYHAFGSDILAQYKNYASEFDRKLDEPIAPVFQYKIIKKIQQKIDAMDILKTADISDIIDTISNAKSARLTPDDLEQIANFNLSAAEEINADVSEILNTNLVPRMKFHDAVEQVYNPICEVLASYCSPEPILKNIEREANILLYDLNKAIQDESANEKPKLKPLSAWKDKYFEKDENGNYRLKNVISNKKLKSISNIMRLYNEHLIENGLFDFSDMIEESIRILKSDTGFRLSLSEKYQFILLDEFQDTNPSQLEIIHLLTDYEKPAVMAVGDDDQAIFSFQGANASNLLDFQNYYNAKVVTLIENYRSNIEILDLSREVADQIDGSFAKNQNVNKKLNSFKGTGAKITRHEFITADAEYFWVAEEINNLIKSGVQQKDIAIITPKHKYIETLLPYLKAHKSINIAYEKRENVLQDPKINEILTLARFVYELSEEKQPSHRILELLSYPFWKISPLTVINAIHHSHTDKISTLEYFTRHEDEKLNFAANFIAKLVAVSYDSPLELFLDYLIGTAPIGEMRSPFLEFYKSEDSYKNFELYDNLSVLREAIKTHTRVQQPKLKDLIEFVDDYEFAKQALLNTSPYQDSTNAIQIITAHKSKGLEYEYVFLIATDNLSWGKAKGNNNKLTLPANLAQIRHTGATEDERLRLFFVALTRAKSHLFITNSIKDFSGKTPARLEYLDEFIDENNQPISPYLQNKEIVTHYQDLDESLRKSDPQTFWSAVYHRITPDIRAILEKRMENYKMTASDLTSFIDIVYAGPLEFYQKKILKAPSESYSATAEYGTLVHETFEQVTTKKLTDAEAIDYFKEKAISEPIPPEELKDILEKGAVSLEKSLKEFGEILREKDARAEVDLYKEHIMLDEVPITGKIDHIKVNKEEKTIEIYDFKTGKFHDAKWTSHVTLYKYAMQLMFYKLLLNNSNTYKDYEITKAHILFVTPDENGKVYDKVYDYNTKDEENLKQLIKVIYNHIKKIDFLDDPELAIPANDKNRLVDIKDFIEKLLAK